jgi:hypothetical protein
MATSAVPPVNSTKSIDAAPLGASANIASSSAQAASDATNFVEAMAVKTLKPEDAREKGFRVVIDPATRVSRMRQLCDLLESISPENWRQVVDGFETALRAKREEGGEAYNLLLEQIGAIGGAEAMNDALTPEKVSVRGRAITILKGWANADPKACAAWFEKQPPEIQDAYAGQMVAGISRIDPKTALEITFRPGKGYYLVGTVNAVVNNAVSVVGVQGVEEIFVSMRARNDLSADAKHIFFTKLAETKLAAAQKAGDTAAQVLQWFDVHAGRNYVDANDSARIISQAAKANADDTLSWLDIQMTRLTPEQAKAGYQEIARELQKQTPDKLTEWLNTNPGHPQRDNVMETATGVLLNARDYDGAARMAAAIGNEEARARVIGIVAQRAQQTQIRR